MTPFADREKQLAYLRNYGKRNRLYFIIWNEEHKETKRKYNLNHPNRYNNKTRTKEQVRAHNLIQSHPELKGKECEFCGSTENLVTHHPDYQYPSITVTCCVSCHLIIHKRESD